MVGVDSRPESTTSNGASRQTSKCSTPVDGSITGLVQIDSRPESTKSSETSQQPSKCSSPVDEFGPTKRVVAEPEEQLTSDASTLMQPQGDELTELDVEMKSWEEPCLETLQNKDGERDAFAKVRAAHCGGA